MDNEYYWSISLEPNWVAAAIWRIEDQKAHIVSLSSPTAWEEEDDLVEAVNSVLSSTVQKFPEEASEPTKTVFGVPSSWVKDGTIEKEHLDKIRKVCSKLSLTPSGFVVLAEAVAHYIKVDEDAPLNGVILGVGSNNIEITLFRLGNLVGTVNVSRSVSPVDDLVEGLVRFATSDPIPSRFIMYDGKVGDLEEVRQQLTKGDLSDAHEKIKFLHPPKIEILKPKKKMVAVCLAGASELGEVKGVEVEGEEEASEAQSASGGRKNLVVKVETLDDKKQQKASDSEVPADAGEQPDAQSAGFVIDKDIAHETAEPAKSQPQKKSSPIASIFKLFSKFKKAKKPTLPKSNLGGSKLKRTATTFGVLAILLLVGGVLAWWFLPKTEVAVYISPKTLEETVRVNLDPFTKELDLEEKILPVETVTATVSGDKSKSTTGFKVVGEKASGSVTVRNGTSSSIKLSAGTIFFGPNDLKFSLQQEASISAATSPTEPGTEKLEISAENFGSEYNLAKDEDLTVGNYPESEVDAVIESELSGGSSHEVVVVSEDDLDDLLSELTEELVTKGKDKIKSQIGDSQIFVNDVVESSPNQKDFSHKEGDEAETLLLDLDLDVTGIIIPKKDFNKFTDKLLGGLVPDGFTLRQEQIQTEFNLLDEEEDGTWIYSLTLKANLLPEFDPEQIADKIKGKYLTVAESFLSTIPGYTRSEITLMPNLPGRLETIAHITKNITIEIVAER